MKRSLLLCLVTVLLLSTAHRAPAPISEESPTPAPEKSTQPKPKQTTKKASESSESSAKEKTSSPAPRPTPNRNPFDGTWRGIIRVGLAGDHDLTFQVSASGTVLTTNARFPDWSKTLTPTCDLHTMSWKTTSIQVWTLTPNSDGRTAIVTGTDPGSLFWFGAFNSKATFRKVSP